MGTDCQRGVEQQDTLFGPTCQIATLRNGRPQVLLYFFEDVLQGGRKLYAVLHREAKPMRLTWFMVGVLTNDNHLHLVEGTEVESIENLGTWWITGRRGVLLTHGASELLEVGLLKLLLQVFLPSGFYLYIHSMLFNQVISTASQWLDNALHLQREKQGSKLTNGDISTHTKHIQLQVVGLLQQVHDALFISSEVWE